MKKFLFKLLNLTFLEWVEFGVEKYNPTTEELVDIIFQHNNENPTLEEWVKLTSQFFDVEEFKAAAYNYRIKMEAAMADELGIGDAFRYGSEAVKAEQEALAAASNPKRRLAGGVLALGKTPQERERARLMEREDLLIGNMVKRVAKEAGVEAVE